MPRSLSEATACIVTDVVAQRKMRLFHEQIPSAWADGCGRKIDHRASAVLDPGSWTAFPHHLRYHHQNITLAFHFHRNTALNRGAATEEMALR